MFSINIPPVKLNIEITSRLILDIPGDHSIWSRFPYFWNLVQEEFFPDIEKWVLAQFSGSAYNIVKHTSVEKIKSV